MIAKNGTIGNACIIMTDNIYSTLNNVYWHCDNCGMPNFNISLFESVTMNTSNSFQSFSSSGLSPVLEHSFSVGQPKHASSPISTKPTDKQEKLNNVRILVINFQSLKNKSEERGILY